MPTGFTVKRGANVRSALALAFMTISGACTAPIGASGETVQFICTVNGLASTKSGIDEDAVCAEFKARIDQARGQRSEAVKALSLAGNRNWLKLDVTIAKGRSAAAVLTHKTNAKQHVYPEVVIDVMDKALGQQELEKLAAEVAKLLVEDNHG